MKVKIEYLFASNELIINMILSEKATILLESIRKMTILSQLGIYETMIRILNTRSTKLKNRCFVKEIFASYLLLCLFGFVYLVIVLI
jgi:hypothetical protein